MSPASYLTAPPRVAGAIVAPLGLGCDHADRAADTRSAEAAVAVRVLLQVLLVVRLGVVELARRRQFRGDLAVAGAAQLVRIHHSRALDGGALRLVRVVRGRAVLRADVVALAHALCGVVVFPEEL